MAVGMHMIRDRKKCRMGTIRFDILFEGTER
jgi:hypothetical protein